MPVVLEYVKDKSFPLELCDIPDTKENTMDITIATANDSTKLELLSPWMIHAKKVHALFGEDPDISMTYQDDGTSPRVKIFVKNPIKATCIDKIIKHEIIFGNITLYVDVIPSNEAISVDQLFRMAFVGNPLFSEFVSESTPFGTVNYTIFNPQIIQYLSDDTSDVYGLDSVLAEDLAREVLNDEFAVNYCTDVVDPTIPNWP